MIPTQTLRQRMTEALKPWFEVPSPPGMEEFHAGVMKELDVAIQAAIDAIGDPVLIKTADSLEPTFTLRAQDKAAGYAVEAWIFEAHQNGTPQKKLDEGQRLLASYEWPTRKWPD